MKAVLIGLLLLISVAVKVQSQYVEYDEFGRQKGSVECTLCKLVIGRLEEMLESNKTEEAIIKALDKVCDKVPIIAKDSCKLFVGKYTPLIIKYLVKYETPERFCGFIKLCAKVDESYSIDKTATCEVCKFIISELEKLLKENRTEEAIIKALDKVCIKMSPVIKQICIEFVKQYTPIIIDYLVKKGDPKKLCHYLGMCSTVAVFEKQFECVMCEAFIEMLEKIIEAPYTEEKIKEAVLKVCPMLPELVRPSCDYIVKNYLPQIIDYIIKFKTPRELCYYIKLCP
jgi:saposin